MSTDTQPDFIVIDDDEINNFICLNIIKSLCPHADIKTFTDPQLGLLHIQSIDSGRRNRDVVLFLDLNMPVLSGWEVLSRFEKLPSFNEEHFKTFILSSSIAAEDKERANENKLVFGFIEKPLTRQNLTTLLAGSS
jgi:CheY-like chemotaxis protein